MPTIDKHIIQLDFLKFFAAVIVVLFHYWSPAQNIRVHLPVIRDFIANGNLAVHFFFVLSGFLLTHVELYNPSGNIKQFYKKRLLRIYPLYFVALVLCIVISWREIDYKAVVINVFGLQQLFAADHNTLNPPSWTISQLFIFYFAFPYVFLIIRKNVAKYSLYIVGCLVLFFAIDFYFLDLPLFHYPHWVFVSFVLGIGSRGILQEKKICLFFSQYYAWIVGISLIFLIYFVSILHFNYWHGSIFIILTFCLILCSLCFLPKDSKALIKNPKIAYLGNFSYSVYLFQHPIYVLILGLLSNRPNVLFIVFFFILLISSGLIYLFIEKPLGKLLNRFLI